MRARILLAQTEIYFGGFAISANPKNHKEDRKMKKTMCAVLGAALVLSGASAVSAQDEKITVNLNGETLSFDVNPIIENDRTLVPFRTIFEKLDCAVSYSEYDGEQVVTAERGSKYISLTIGEKTMFAGGEEITLDVAPKVVNDRTLIPLRAVSESLDCRVDWLEDTNTVAIYKDEGQYPVTSGNIDKTVTADDGTNLMTISCAYPIIGGGNDLNKDFIAKINEEYKTRAQNYMAETEKEYAADAKDLINEMGAESYRPMNFCLSFEVNTNRKNWLSITVFDYRNYNGAHPLTTCDSRNYQMLMCKELALTDALGREQEDLNADIIKAFNQWYKDNEVQVNDVMTSNLEKEAANVNWEIHDDSILLYFNQYQIAPYVYGMPAVEVPYNASEGDIAIDLSEANLDKLEFELDGNPTTGYAWKVKEADPTKVEITDEYIEDKVDENIVGAGGKYKFTVTPKAPGNLTVECVYSRSFEPSESDKTVTYKLLVTKDNKITVLDKTEE